MNYNNNDKKINQLKRQIKELEDEQAKRQAYVDSLTPEQRIAELLHYRQCHSNHTDGCGFYYDKWEDVDTQKWSSKREWLIKARELIAVEPNVEHLIEILQRI